MANQFLVQIHQFISDRQASSRQSVDQSRSRGDRGRESFHQGRLDELQKLRDFLGEQFDLDTQTYY